MVEQGLGVGNAGPRRTANGSVAGLQDHRLLDPVADGAFGREVVGIAGVGQANDAIGVLYAHYCFRACDTAAVEALVLVDNVAVLFEQQLEGGPHVGSAIGGDVAPSTM